MPHAAGELKAKFAQPPTRAAGTSDGEQAGPISAEPLAWHKAVIRDVPAPAGKITGV